MGQAKLKVTICSHDGKDYFGGPYEWVKRFGPALRDAGVDVSFLFFSDHQAKDSSTYLYLKELGFSCELLPHHSLLQYHDNTEDRVRWCLEQVSRNPPDVFIANAVLPALFAGKWIKQSGIPVIGVLHTDDARHEWLQEEFVQGSIDFCLSALVCVSELLHQKIIPLNIFHIPLEVISCGTPLPLHHKSKDSSVLKLVYAGKLTEDAKQISLLTKAFCQVVKEVKGVEAYLYGEGPSKEKVMKIIREEAQGYPVYYEGFIPSTEIQEKIADKHVIVLLSDYEGLPIILMEGMACGLVPVCLNIRSGIPELVKHEETGLLVNDRGSDFMQAIKRLKEDQSLLQLLSEQALHYINAHHAMPVVVDKWMTLINRLIGGARKTKLVIPDRIVLPSIHPQLIGEDERKQALMPYLKKQVLRIKRNRF